MKKVKVEGGDGAEAGERERRQKRLKILWKKKSQKIWNRKNIHKIEQTQVPSQKAGQKPRRKQKQPKHQPIPTGRDVLRLRPLVRVRALRVRPNQNLNEGKVPRKMMKVIPRRKLNL